MTLLFLQVCVCPQEGCLPHCMLGPETDIPRGQTAPSAQCMLGYGQQAGGTHPTGIHSCSRCEWTLSVMIVYSARIAWRHVSVASLLTELVIGTN